MRNFNSPPNDVRPSPDKPRSEISNTRNSLAQTINNPDSLKSPEILNGEGLESLSEDIREYRTASGDVIYAATDKGKNYKDEDEDRVGINPEANLVVVVDGVGGWKNSSLCADFVASSFVENPDDPAKAAKLASELINKVASSKEGGACFASVKITVDNGQKYLNISKAGDVKILIFEDDELVLESRDDSYVCLLLDSLDITSDEALYHPHRNIVTHFIDAKRDSAHILKPIPVKKGAKVIIYTDGIGDNISPDELLRFLSGRDWGGTEIIKLLSDITDRRMDIAEDIAALNGSVEKDRSDFNNEEDYLRYLEVRKKYLSLREKRKVKGEYSDGYKTEPKPDNRGIAIVEIL